MADSPRVPASDPDDDSVDPAAEPDSEGHAEAQATVEQLTAPAEGVPPVTADQPALQRAISALSSGSGPVAVHAERASGYRYGQRAYLVQLRREGAGSWLIDPISLPDLSPV